MGHNMHIAARHASSSWLQRLDGAAPTGGRPLLQCHQRRQRAGAWPAAAERPRQSAVVAASLENSSQAHSHSHALVPQQQAQQRRRQRGGQHRLIADQQLWAEIEAVGQRAEDLERSGQYEDAIELLKSSLEQLQRQHGLDFSLTVLRQMLWDALYSTARHREALLVAAQVHAAVQEQFGAGSAEVQLVTVRLGMSTAACGKLEAGLSLIYDATPVLQHNLGRLVEQANALAAAEGGYDEQAAASLEDNIDKLAAALGEGNMYGALLTMRHAVETGRQAGVVEGWQELQEILASGFCQLMVVAGGPQGPAVQAALRDHDRLTQDLAGEVLLARLVQAQNEWLHEIAEQGLAHPIFAQAGGDAQG